MRRGEISNLKRENIDLNVPSAAVKDTKNSKNKTVPLMPEAAALLKSLPARLDGFVFGLRGGASHKHLSALGIVRMQSILHIVL